MAHGMDCVVEVRTCQEGKRRAQSDVERDREEWMRRDKLYRERRNEALQARLQQTVSAPAPAPAPAPVPAPEPKPGFEPGLIVHITNLHPDSNKPTISSFVMRSVDRYLRKRDKKSSPPSSPPPKAQINYIDFKRGATSSYLRQSTRRDSDLIVTALKKRKRAMADGDDRKGRKTKEGYVAGRLLEGAEEAEYWRMVQATMGEAGKKKKEKRRKKEAAEDRVSAVVDVDVRGAGKRPRSSGASPRGGLGKRTKVGESKSRN